MVAGYLTLSDFFETVYVPFRFPHAPHGATAADYRQQIANLNHFHRSIDRGEVTLGDLSDELLTGAIRWQLDRGRTPATCNKLARTIGAIWRFAKRRKLLDTSPEVDRLPELRRDPECWSMDELQKILDTASGWPGNVGTIEAGPWWSAILWTVMNTGCRISAIMATPTANVDLDGGWIRIPAEAQKDGEDATFDLLPQTVQAVSGIDPHGRALHHLFDDWPFDRGGRQWKALNREFRGILTAAGLPNTRRDLWHKLRRTFGTFVAAAAGEAVAQTMLGHSSVQTTRRYLDKRMITRPLIASMITFPERPQLRVFRPA